MIHSLMIIAVFLTCTMFFTRQSMLGFACVIFWAILGSYSYTLSIDPWGDVYYYVFFGSMGMSIFTGLAAYGLREKRDTLADVEMDEEEAEKEKEYIGDDEKDMFSLEDKGKASKRVKKLRERAEKRRKGEFSAKRKPKW